MINGALDPEPAPLDFGLKCGNPGFELLDRQPIDILPDELVHRIVGTLREKIVGLHADNVDRDARHVNKPGPNSTKEELAWPKFRIG